MQTSTASAEASAIRRREALAHPPRLDRADLGVGELDHEGQDVARRVVSHARLKKKLR